MKRRIVFATGNENKMKEIRMILSDLNTEWISILWKTECLLKKMQRLRRDR